MTASAGPRTSVRPEAPAPDPVTVVVRPGDSPWALAQEHLGEGARWTEIWELNRGVPQPDGRSWDSPETIMPGWQFALPAGAAAPGMLGPGQVMVQPDDNPWSLAETHLGDGKRWRELFDANRGRVQTDGDAWVTESLVQPGWVLDLPAASASAPAPLPAPAPAPPPVEAPVAEAPPAPAPAPPPVEAPAPVPPPVPASPPVEAPVAEAPPAPSPPSPPTTVAEPQPDPQPEPGAAPAPSPRTAPTNSVSEPEPAAPAGDGDEEVDLDIAPLLVAGIPAVLAAGIVLRLDRVRRRRARRRPPGAAVPVPAPELQATERRWRAIADHESADWVDTALRYLTWAVRSTGAPISVVGVRTGANGLELLLSTPARQGAPRFAADESGWQWRLKCEDLSEIRGIAADEPPYAPGLVTLGTTDDGSTVLVDVEQLGLTSVEGDEAVVRAWLAGVALDVATAPWAGEVDLRLVGGLVELAALEQVALLDLDDVPGAVEGVVAATTRSLGLRPSTQAARGAAGREPWPPVTVVVAVPGADQPVVDVAVPGRGAAVVAAGPVPRAAVRLVAGADGYATLYPYGLAVRLSAVDDRTAGDTARLLAGAAEPVDAPAEPVPAPAQEPAPWPAVPSTPAVEAGEAGEAPAAAEEDDPPVPGWAAPVAEETMDVQSRYAALIRSILEPGEVEVVVLGSPQVTGWEHEPRQRSVEIVCYLAVHDGAVTGDKLRDAVFPPGFKATSLRQAVSRTRTALGRSAAGYQHILPAFAAGSYELGPAVRSDYRRFQALVAAARKAPADCEIKLLRTALGLVRSQPFSDTPPGGYGWASAEGISYALERLVTDAAHRLGELALAADDPRLAEWAARQGQRAVPGHEGLYRDLAMAKLHQGDVDGFMAVRREAEAAATTFDALDALQPETQEFFTKALAEYRDLRQAANDH
jgi:nucleoid-associated protein YgaU